MTLSIDDAYFYVYFWTSQLLFIITCRSIFLFHLPFSIIINIIINIIIKAIVSHFSSSRKYFFFIFLSLSLFYSYLKSIYGWKKMSKEIIVVLWLKRILFLCNVWNRRYFDVILWFLNGRAEKGGNILILLKCMAILLPFWNKSNWKKFSILKWFIFGRKYEKFLAKTAVLCTVHTEDSLNYH